MQQLPGFTPLIQIAIRERARSSAHPERGAQTIAWHDKNQLTNIVALPGKGSWAPFPLPPSLRIVIPEIVLAELGIMDNKNVKSIAIIMNKIAIPL